MNTRQFLYIGLLVTMIAFLTACAGTRTAPPDSIAPQVSSTSTSLLPTITPTTISATATFAPTQTASPVDFVWRYKGEVSKDTRLDQPHGLAFDAQDNLYIADTKSSRIYKLDRDGNFLLQWGSRGNGDGQFVFLYNNSLAVDSQGLVLVATANGYVQIFDGQGKFLRKWGGGHGTDNGQFIGPGCMAIDQQGNIYIADHQDDVISRVQKFDAQGNFLMKWSAATGTTNCLAIDKHNNVYIVNATQYRIEKYDSQGNLLSMWGSKGKGEGQFVEPTGIAIDSRGNVYVADNRSTFRIEKFDSNGKFLGQWGGWGVGDGQFWFCCTLAIDSQDNIYATDDGANNSVQKFRPR